MTLVNPPPLADREVADRAPIRQAAEALLRLIDAASAADAAAWQPVRDALRLRLSRQQPDPSGPPHKPAGWHRQSLAEFLGGQLRWLDDSPGTGAERPLDELSIDCDRSVLAESLATFCQQGGARGQPLDRQVAEVMGNRLILRLEGTFESRLLQPLQAVVEHHGGTLQRARLAAQGSERLRITLPILGNASPSQQTGGAKRCVLVVDDNPNVRFQIRQSLQHRFDVVEAGSLAQAQVRLAQTLPDLIISDIHLPDGSGFELASGVRDDPAMAAIPILFLTAYDSADNELHAFLAGGDQFMAKPFLSDVLLGKLQRMLTSRAQANQTVCPADVPTPADEGYGDLKARINTVLRARFQDPDFDVDELCQTLAMGRSALYAALKENRQPPPADLIRSFRLENAARHLARSKATITEVANRVGFRRLSAFTRTFQAHYGQTPSAYRHQNRHGTASG